MRDPFNAVYEFRRRFVSDLVWLGAGLVAMGIGIVVSIRSIPGAVAAIVLALIGLALVIIGVRRTRQGRGTPVSSRVVVGVVALALGVVGLVGVATSARQDQAHNEYLREHGVATAATVVEVVDRSRTGEPLRVRVRYPVNGGEVSAELDVSDLTGSPAPSQEVNVVYDPSKPTDVKLATTIGTSAWAAVWPILLVLGAVVTLGLILLLVGVLRRPKT